MYKIAALFIVFVLSATAYALPIGNPWEASLMRDGIFREGHCASYCDPCISWCDAWSFRVGFYGDYVYNYHMEVDRHDHHDNIHDTEIWTNAAYLAFNMFDRFDFFATLGTSEFEIYTPRKAFGGSGDNDFETIKTDTDFSWSIGIRATLWECGCLGIGGEAQYFSACPDINFVKRENSDPDYRDGDGFEYQEWQIGFGAAYRINIASCATALVPYLGIKWGRAWIDMGNIESNGLTIHDLRSDKLFGYAFGITLLGCNKASVTAEARFIDEKALYVNGQFRF
jgi:major outer membrane protein